ncbi:hypothetical protein OHD62_19540 [Mesorhizobium sp. YC-39]|uniref:hypothetical protein n=1 Tax=unclassified Mesorhizobium TaxID=325217 RepID=UPI0021E871D5|nr:MULTISPECIES: hypothetical protein [unclassified Mesorhizobium]MCV3210038.1 hypothetical protein [Mesorhizobium sp. YC-2]MCV3230568.1 hypothetical protein [Mesorhizobium sp. YC-39]
MGSSYGKTPVAIFIKENVKSTNQSLKDIEEQTGISVHTLDLVISGRVEVPFNWIPALATALRVDAIHLFFLAFQQYFKSDLIYDICQLSINERNPNECGWVKALRAVHRR